MTVPSTFRFIEFTIVIGSASCIIPFNAGWFNKSWSCKTFSLSRIFTSDFKNTNADFFGSGVRPRCSWIQWYVSSSNSNASSLHCTMEWYTVDESTTYPKKMLTKKKRAKTSTILIDVLWCLLLGSAPCSAFRLSVPAPSTAHRNLFK